MRLIADCGTSWTTIMELESGQVKIVPSAARASRFGV